MAIRSFSEIIKLWPSAIDLAEDLRQPSETLAQSYARVRKWKQRDRIPDEHWAGLLKAGSKRGIKIEAAHLVSIASQAR